MDEPATIADLAHRLADSERRLADSERRLAAAEAALREKADLEAALRRSDELRRIAVAGGRMGTWRWNLRDERIRGDAAFLKLWGYPASEAPRRLSDFTDRMSPEGRAEMGEMVTRALDRDEEFDGELAVVGGPTDGHWVRWRGRAERERPWIVNGVSFDVTEQRAADERRRASETRHTLLIESWTQAIWETDAAGAVVSDSPSWRAYTGQTVDEWLGRGWLDAIHPDDRPSAERQWQDAMAARRVVDFEYRLRAPDGGWRWTNVRAAPLLDGAGKIEKWIGVNIDIASRKQAEEALRRSEAKFRTVFESIDEGFLIHEVIRDETSRPIDLRMLEANPALTRLTGLGPDLIGKRQRAVMPGLEQVWLDTFDRVARTGVPERFENYNQPTGRWYSVHISQVGGHDDQVAVVYDDVTTRKRSEIALRASEERQAFLLGLSDALRPLEDPLAIQREACRVLRHLLDATRVAYLEMRPDGTTSTVMAEAMAEGAFSLVDAIWDWMDFDPAGLESVRLGLTIGRPDVQAADDLSPDLKANFARYGVRAFVATPLVKSGRFVAYFLAHFGQPLQKDPVAFALLEETAERTWAAVERARAEAALRASEERFRQFAEASAAGLWIRAADTLAMEFASPAIATMYGVDTDALLGDVTRWAALIVPDDRDLALDALTAARQGEAMAHEFRIQRPVDGAFRWIRNTNFPLRDDGHIPRIGGIAEDVTEARLAAEHSAVLLAELQHRVRNIMALLRSITNRTAERAENVPEYRDLMKGRLLAFARVQALLTRAANASVGIASIVHDEVGVQAQHEGHYAVDGPDVALSPKAAEVLTLAIHELATNAVKYGALSVPDGKVSVRWSTFEVRGGPWLAFDWTEDGAPARSPPAPDAPRRRGFGSELIEGRIPYELRGRGQLTIEPGGARCHLAFPLQAGASILETGAPQRATVFGGTIDMTGEPDLTGRRVLVVEDDYYLATDAARALRSAGAEVLGPCATEADARAELAEQRPDAVVVDINLGAGPSFKLAETLKDRGIPFVFTTGYDAEVIPAEFEGVERLEKPLHLRQIVGAVAKLAPAAEPGSGRTE